MINIKHKNIVNMECTHFEKIKVCVFIFASFKNAIDWVIIEMPLKEIIPEVKTIDSVEIFSDNVLAPLVTSNIP